MASESKISGDWHPKNEGSSAYANLSSPSRVRVRLFHDFEKPRSGRELFVPAIKSAPCGEPRNEEIFRASVSSIQKIIEEEVDLACFVPHVYDGLAECFVPLSSVTTGTVIAERGPSINALVPPRIDVKLVMRRNMTVPSLTSPLSVGDIASRVTCDSSAAGLTSSWFGIGILRGKTAANHGTLWRSALQFGASLTFTIGRRYERRVEGCADVYKTLRQVPCVPYTDVAAFMSMAPVDVQIVVVEYGGVDLASFVHPKRALYVLGSEDAGVPPALVARAHAHVEVPTAEGRPASLNVATTGAIIMYDRLVKLQKAKAPQNEQTRQEHTAFANGKDGASDNTVVETEKQEKTQTLT